MDAFGGTLHWLLSPAHWSGSDGIPTRVFEHVEMCVLATAAAASVAIPAGLWIGHTRRAEFLAVSVANVGRALPTFGVLGFVFPFTLSLPGLGFWPTLIALFVLAIPPILTNTYVGVRNVDPDTVEAARGMGLSEREVLGQVEVPLAVPVIVAGVRTATVTVIATAALAALFGWGGLGRYIIDGFSQHETAEMISGAVLVALLAIASEVVLAVTEKAVTPRTSGERAGIASLLRPGWRPSRQGSPA